LAQLCPIAIVASRHELTVVRGQQPSLTGDWPSVELLHRYGGCDGTSNQGKVYRYRVPSRRPQSVSAATNVGKPKSRAPHGGLEEYDESDLEVNARLALERCQELHSAGDELSAESWGERWNELMDELTRRREAGTSVKTARAKPGRTRKPAKGAKEPRIYWRYAPVPLAIIDDPKLSVNAKGDYGRDGATVEPRSLEYRPKHRR
jgi:hypothetical protein